MDNPFGETEQTVHNYSSDSKNNLNIDYDFLLPKEILKNIFDSISDVIVIVDLQGNIAFVNKHCEKLFGFRQDELIGKSIEILVPEKFTNHAKIRSTFQENPDKRMMGNRPVIPAKHKSGKEIPVDISLFPYPSVEGYGKLFQATIKDAMPRWELNEDLLLQSVAMSAAANGIVITDIKGIIKWVNPAITLITGYPSHELIGQHTRILNSGMHDNNFFKNLWETIVKGETWYGEITNKRKNGTIYYEEQHIAPVINEEGKLTNFIAIKQDVTARKIAEIKLQELNEELKLKLIEIEKLNQKIQEQAIRDPLTNLFNRRYLDESIILEIAREKRNLSGLSVMLLDADSFKQLNDSEGHPAGDLLLKSLSLLLTNNFRKNDIICRLGGDEFLILLPGTPLSVAEQKAEFIRNTFVQEQLIEQNSNNKIICSLSIGVTQYRVRNEPETPELLIKRVDNALYQAKESGRNKVVAIP